MGEGNVLPPAVPDIEDVRRLTTGEISSFRARQTSTGRSVFLAVLDPQAEAVLSARFERDLRLLQSAEDPPPPVLLVTTDCTRTSSRVAVYLDPGGFALAAWVKDRRPSPREAAAIALALVVELLERQKEGREVAAFLPANVLIDVSGRPVLLPIPIAPALSKDATADARASIARVIEVAAGLEEGSAPGSADAERLAAIAASLRPKVTGRSDLETAAGELARLLLDAPQTVPAGIEPVAAGTWRSLLTIDTGAVDLVPAASRALQRAKKARRSELRVAVQPVEAPPLDPVPAEPVVPPTKKWQRTGYYNAEGGLAAQLEPQSVGGGKGREQFAWDEAIPDWQQILNKREYYFRYLASETSENFPRLADGGPGEPVELVSGSEITDDRILLSEDGSRAYKPIRELGRGGQGAVYEVDVAGEQAFEGFDEPVTRAALKVGYSDPAIERERQAYERIRHHGVVKLLDTGIVQGRAQPHRYLVLERLYPHPYMLFGDSQSPCRVDPATAVDSFLNLLEALHSLHFRRDRPIVLCDIKPENIMLRMSNREGSPPIAEYLRRIATGAFEPVLMDMGCAQDREALRVKGGRLEELIGTPVYLPPEAIPTVDDDFTPGVYSDKTDIYALTLSFYEFLTGERPYGALGLWRSTHGGERLLRLLTLKGERASPIDEGLLRERTGDDAPVFLEILKMGLEPDPELRPSALALLEQAKRVFRAKQRFVREVGEYRYDQAKGLRLMQDRFPRIDPVANHYVQAFKTKNDVIRRAGLATREFEDEADA